MIVKRSGIVLLLSLSFLKIPSISAVNVTFSNNEKEKIDEEPTNRIVGGYGCPIKRYPFLVSLRYINAKTHFCAGTLLSKFWILTTMRCLAHKCNRPLEAIAGSNVAWNVVKNSNNQSVQFSTISLCYLYPINRLEFDIALARLKTPILETDNVRYVKLPFSLFSKNGSLKGACSNSTVAGWGLQYALNSSGYPIDLPIPEYASHLQCVHLPIISREECTRRVKFKLAPSLFCTYHPKKRDVCFGDSGGPLMCDDYQYGIISASSGCAVNDKAGIFINISYFREFILTTLASPDEAKSTGSTIYAVKLTAVLVIIVLSKLYIC